MNAKIDAFSFFSLNDIYSHPITVGYAWDGRPALHAHPIPMGWEHMPPKSKFRVHLIVLLS